MSALPSLYGGPAPLPASEKQVSYILSLITKRQVPTQLAHMTRDDALALDRREASRLIEKILDMPVKVEPPTIRPDARPESGIDIHDIPSGRYAVTGLNGTTVFYKIDSITDARNDITGARSRWAGWVFVSLVSGGDLDGTKAGSARPGESYRGTHGAAMQQILADPKEAAIRYGRETGSCAMCGRLLTDPASVAAGIGPVCAGRF